MNTALEKSLPTPDQRAIDHSAALKARIVDAITQSNNKISFERYMEMALYEPGFGYYCAGQTRFGRQGDFITAPGLSPLFGETLALFCEQTLKTSSHKHILEYGAGTGQLAVSLCRQLLNNNFPLTDYFIIDVSPDLKAQQQKAIKEAGLDKHIQFHWVDAVSDFMGVVLANEVLDAMPVHKVQIKDNALHSYFVTLDKDNNFAFSVEKTSCPNLHAYADHYELLTGQLPEPYTTEIQLNTLPWLKHIASQLKQGTVLLIDYGFPAHSFYHPERSHGTLMCHYQHQAHEEVFFYPGLQDITAHVNFSDVAKSAEETGFTVDNWQSQAHFLIEQGLLQLGEKKFPTLSQQAQFALSHHIQTLTSPNEMGELFQVMVLKKD